MDSVSPRMRFRSTCPPNERSVSALLVSFFSDNGVKVAFSSITNRLFRPRPLSKNAVLTSGTLIDAQQRNQSGAKP